MHNKLKELRISKKLSQKELAEMMKVSRSCIANWENGSRQPQSPHIAQYFRIFRLPNNFFSPSSKDKGFETKNCFDLSVLNYKGVQKLYTYYEELLKNKEYLKKH